MPTQVSPEINRRMLKERERERGGERERERERERGAEGGSCPCILAVLLFVPTYSDKRSADTLYA